MSILLIVFLQSHRLRGRDNRSLRPSVREYFVLPDVPSTVRHFHHPMVPAIPIVDVVLRPDAGGRDLLDDSDELEILLVRLGAQGLEYQF